MQQSTVPELVYAVGHDISEPIREVLGFAELLGERLPQDVDIRVWDDLNHIEAGARRARTMLNALCDYLLVDEIDPVVAEVDLEELHDEVLLETCQLRSEHRATITAAFHGRVRTYPEILRDVLVELVGNAARFGASRDGVAHVDLEVTIADGVLRVTVSDQGPGLDPDAIERATKLFQRLGRRATHETTGAGLALARRKIERCGGELTLARGELSDGLVATVALPIPVIDLRAPAPEIDLQVAS